MIVKKIRATDAKEVGVENPAEETFRYPNQNLFRAQRAVPTCNRTAVDAKALEMIFCSGISSLNDSALQLPTANPRSFTRALSEGRSLWFCRIEKPSTDDNFPP